MQARHTPLKLTSASLEELVGLHARPCLSPYMGTHRSHPDNQQDPVRFRHLVGALKTSLHHQAPDALRALTAPFEALDNGHAFWEHTLDGLVVMGATDFFRICVLPRPVADLAVMADSFHTQALRQFLQSVERYLVLALSLNKMQLFEGSRDSLEALSLSSEDPRSSSDTSSDRQQTAHSSVSSYGGLGAGHSAMHHGQAGKKDGMDSEMERFYRAVDRAVQAHHSDVSGLPLMLAALPEHHHLFQAISHNPRLMKQGLLINPESLSPTELQQRAWAVAAPAQRAASTIPNLATPGSTMCWTTWARWLRNWAAKCMFWRPNACPQPRVLQRVIATEAAKLHPRHSWMAFPISSRASSNSGACAS